ncbi:MAG: hypothetical protein KU38_00890 [Sulfurovum sp. FS08-3]|nr:MAG: hypothetical protein KU38_00890 [Sulfurovum sp. FS08-3]
MRTQTDEEALESCIESSLLEQGFIKGFNSDFDKAIELQQNYISKLKEYKASLISVVTGKVRV